MTTIHTTQPRNVNYWRAAGLLYGDLGTSKAYVLGLAYALAMHASFWYILAISILTLLVGINYIFICKFYPAGGGVYSSVRDRSQVLSVIGAFFIISDYLVTAALSSLSAFNYLGVAQPEIWAICSIFLIGLLNILGPKETGSLAVALAIPTVVCVCILGIVAIPFLPKAVHLLTPISGDLKNDWKIFVGMIVALSGIEAIANTTSSMKLDPGFTKKNPSVFKTSTPAIVMVILEVSFFTALFALAMNALPGLEVSNGEVSAPGYPNVRDAMLRYMGETYAGALFGEMAGKIFSSIISVVVTLLLLSAVNTAIVALSSLLFVMSRDREMPYFFQKLNRFGVPFYSLAIAFSIPMLILIFIHNIAGLANLYAIGFVGAITVNLLATSTNVKLDFPMSRRLFMFGTGLIMAVIELTLFIDKPEARGFVVGIISVGLILRALAFERRALEVPAVAPLPAVSQPTKAHWMVALTGVNKSLDDALRESEMHGAFLHILFVKEQKFVTETDALVDWKEDPAARQVYEYVRAKQPKNPIEFLYTVTAHTAHSIAEIARGKNVDQVWLGRARRTTALISMLRGTSARDIARVLPDNVELIVVY